MSTPEGSTSNAEEQQDSKGLWAKKGVIERGLGRDFNITVIAALLSLVVALTTTMITNRMAVENALKAARRDREREAIVRLEQALLKETNATVAVVADGLPATFPGAAEAVANTRRRSEPSRPVSNHVIDYLSAQRECDAARAAVEDARVKAATKQVSDLNYKLAHARSEEEAQQYASQLREVRQKAIDLINETLRRL